MNHAHARLTATVIAIVAGGWGCQTEQALQPSPADRGGPPPARTMLAADGELAQRVRAELARDPLLAHTPIRVEPVGAGLWLRGMVRTRVEQQRAMEIARHAAGHPRINDALIRRGDSGVAAGPLPDVQIHL